LTWNRQEAASDKSLTDQVLQLTQYDVQLTVVIDVVQTDNESVHSSQCLPAMIFKVHSLKISANVFIRSPRLTLDTPIFRQNY